MATGLLTRKSRIVELAADIALGHYAECTMTASQKCTHRIAIYCGSSTGGDAAYMAEARALGAAIAEAGMGVVYGGASVGLMGALAGAALAADGEVIDVLAGVLVRPQCGMGASSDVALEPRCCRCRLMPSIRNAESASMTPIASRPPA